MPVLKWILITTYSCLSHWLHYPLDCGGLLIDLEVVLALE
ncbi:INSIG2 isoform 7 [Pan troglodytes]|uniref:INSIG2 isoform 7 n=2 Tax=Hominidae TaxID=9604 RepID=A0A2J8VMA3_PONAB|nr:INSIG2 isoform 7 [Pan troglodytes]PNJ58657.1 INSIG2 isoform 7 [Pongo abelii]